MSEGCVKKKKITIQLISDKFDYAILQLFFRGKCRMDQEGVGTLLSRLDRVEGDVSGSDALPCRRLWRNAPPFDFDDEGKEMTLGIRTVDKRAGEIPARIMRVAWEPKYTGPR